MWPSNATVAHDITMSSISNCNSSSSSSSPSLRAMESAFVSIFSAAVGDGDPAASNDGSGHDDTGAGSSHQEFEALSLGVLFTVMLIFLGGTFFMTHRHRIPLPYTVVLFLYGIIVGAVARLVAPGVAAALGEIPPELLFYIFLPVLIFEGSFAMNVHALRRVFWQTLILATVGIVINTAILGCAVKVVYRDWSWYAAFLLGSLLSATDPVAVVSLLKNLSVNKHITAMVDGEAVMNDGTAIIIFSLLLPAAKAGHVTMPVWKILLQCIRLALLPVVIGPAFGFIQGFWLRRAKDGLTKACVTVSVTYVSYHVAAQWIGASGVLTLFFQGIFLSYYYPSLFPGVEGSNLISSTWEFLVHLGNTVLFSLVGVILVADVAPTVEPIDIAIVLGMYAVMIIARLVMLESLLPVLNRFEYKIDQRKVLLMVHAGLRGGVAATLALAVQQGGLKEGVPILKVTCGVVLLTLLVNATSAEYVVGLLGFRSKEEYRVRQVQYAMEYLYNTEGKALERVKRDTKYRNANWQGVEKYFKQWLRNPFTGMEILPDSEDAMINRLLMAAFKTALWRQRDELVVSETVVAELGRLLAEKIESGTLLSIREMQLYHVDVDGCDEDHHHGGSGNRNRRAHNTNATTSNGDKKRANKAHHGRPPHHRSTPSTEVAVEVADSNSVGLLPAVLSPPRSLGIVVDPDRDADRGRLIDEGDEELIPGSGGAVVSVLQPHPTTASAHHHHYHHGSPSVTFSHQGSYTSSGGGGAEATPQSPVRLDAPSYLPGGGSGDAIVVSRFEATDSMVESLMGRLLPPWVVLAERVFGKGYFTSVHRRAQENAFMSLLAAVKCLTALSSFKYQYVRTAEQAGRVERWLSRQIADGNAAIRFFYSNFPEATNTVASSRAVISVVNELDAAVACLHDRHGIGANVTELLAHVTENIRMHIPAVWEHDVPSKEGELVYQAVAATTLGKGLRKAEIKAIATMGLVKQFTEYDVITLPDNAFLIVVFGSLRALHSRWTTISEHEWAESFGDTVGLEALLIPAELCRDRQRQWQVISGEATALLISFNSINPFLSERSLRAVKALWRAAAVEVCLPFLDKMVTPPPSHADNKREYLVSIVMQGTPLIGPEDCARFDYSTQFHLCFYLRGRDTTGFYGFHTSPGYIPAFFASQAAWLDPNAVLYAVPMNINDSGYVPLNLHNAPGAATAVADTVANNGDATNGSNSDGPLDGTPSLSPAPAAQGSGRSPTTVGGSTSYAAATSSLNSILRGIVPIEASSSSGSNGATRSSRWHNHHHHNDDDNDDDVGSGSGYVSSAYGDGVDDGGDRRDIYNHDDDADGSQSLGGGTYHTGLTRPNSSAMLFSGGGGRSGSGSVASFGSETTTEFTGATAATASPTAHTTTGGITASAAAAGSGGGGGAASFRGTPATACVLQRLADIVTPVPYVNQLLAQYAITLELLCMAALRYIRYPGDELHARHARMTAERALEFLLSFAVELTLLRRAVNTVSEARREKEDVSTQPPDATTTTPGNTSSKSSMNTGRFSGESIDAEFQCKVCAWVRQAALTNKHHLKSLILEMNTFANKRFHRYVAAARQAAAWHPELSSVESVEGLQKFLRTIQAEQRQRRRGEDQ